ncbi:MAG: hypothetical protein M1827_001743 [Pycnora praestabilis]|nr:MAG: hypothetical protein M1827_001743 [Pycnora praestabilis]
MSGHRWSPNRCYHAVDGGPPNSGRPVAVVPWSPPPPPYIAQPPPPSRPDIGFVAVYQNGLMRYQPAPPPGVQSIIPTPRQPPSQPQPPMYTRNDANRAGNMNNPPGASYLQDDRTCKVHIVTAGFPAPYEGERLEFGFNIKKVAISTPLKDLIRMAGAKGDDPAKNGITECIEVGNGVWRKGTTIWSKDERAKKTMKDIGWDESRGTTRRPIYLFVHRQ